MKTNHKLVTALFPVFKMVLMLRAIPLSSTTIVDPAPHSKLEYRTLHPSHNRLTDDRVFIPRVWPKDCTPWEHRFFSPVDKVSEVFHIDRVERFAPEACEKDRVKVVRYILRGRTDMNWESGSFEGVERRDRRPSIMPVLSAEGERNSQLSLRSKVEQGCRTARGTDYSEMPPAGFNEEELFVKVAN